MNKFFFICLISFLGIGKVDAQVWPADGDTLNQIHVLFDVPYNVNAAKYEVVISTAKEFTEGSIVQKIRDRSSQFIVTSSLQFGQKYFWRYTLISSGKKSFFTSPVYNFSISGTRFTDTDYYRNIISVKNTKAILPGYIVMDDAIIMDRDGNVVWTLPPSFEYKGMRNLQLNRDNNFTYTDSKLSYEISPQGKELWRAPLRINKDSISNYHHDIRKLDNGDFLCVADKQPKSVSEPLVSLVFEITPENTVKWVWDEKNFYPVNVRPHINAAVMDDSNKYLYLSNRDISAITKIDVTSGKPVYSIGYQIKGVPYYPNDLFSMQHSVSVMKNGDLMMFNNNMKQVRNTSSSILILSQPEKDKQPQIVWEYVFNFKKEEYNKVGKLGDANELANGNILIGGGPTSHTFEVNKKKEIVWDCLSEIYDTTSKSFIPYMSSNTQFLSGYRVDFITSLYPCRFITYLSDKNKQKELIIKNTGLYTDSYEYTCSDEGKPVTGRITLNPGGTAHLPLKTTIAKIEVNSVRNTQLKKYLTFN